MKIYCPFTNGDCNSKCVFNNNCGDQGEAINCNLADAVNTIRSLQAPNNCLDNRLVEILSQISSVETNTSCIESDVSSICNDIYDIKNTIDKD